jgi:hypothetical protein
MLPSVQWERAPGYAIGSQVNNSCTNKSIIRGLAYHRRCYRKLAEWTTRNASLGFEFIEEPWLRRQGEGRRQMCQPDAVLLDEFTGGGVVVEVKLNWKDGRDDKLIDLYLHAARSAFGLSAVWPLLITKNVRGYKGTPLLGLGQIEKAFEWRPGLITPVMLLP